MTEHFYCPPETPRMYRHYCAEWDGMDIDEGCREFACCQCTEIRGMQNPVDTDVVLMTWERSE